MVFRAVILQQQKAARELKISAVQRRAGGN